MTPQLTLDLFPHTWSAEILPAAPLIAPSRQYLYPRHVPGEEDAIHRGALFVSVKPSSGGTFLATCALGFRDAALPSGVWSCPSPDHLLAVAGGYAYRLDTVHPEAADLLEQRPVTGVVAVPALQLLLLTGFHDILALGPEGVRWRTARLSWEGLTLDPAVGEHLPGFGWDMFSDQEVPFTVDLRTGQHQGGGHRSSS